jgi:hypothetical protein
MIYLFFLFLTLFGFPTILYIINQAAESKYGTSGAALREFYDRHPIVHTYDDLIDEPVPAAFLFILMSAFWPILYGVAIVYFFWNKIFKPFIIQPLIKLVARWL